MKPSWDDAPEWAGWLAMDRDGSWRWFELEPTTAFGMWVSHGLEQRVGSDVIHERSKEPRP